MAYWVVKRPNRKDLPLLQSGNVAGVSFFSEGDIFVFLILYQTSARSVLHYYSTKDHLKSLSNLGLMVDTK